MGTQATLRDLRFLAKKIRWIREITGDLDSTGVALLVLNGDGSVTVVDPEKVSRVTDLEMDLGRDGARTTCSRRR